MTLLFIFNIGRNFGGGDYSIIKFANYLSSYYTIRVISNKKLPPYVTELDVMVIPKFNIKLKGIGIVNKFLERIFWLFQKKLKIDFVVGYLRESAIEAVDIANSINARSIVFHFETPNWLYNEMDDYTLNEHELEIWNKAKRAYLKATFLLSNSKLSQSYCKLWCGRKSDAVVYPGVDKVKVNVCEIKNQIIFIGRLVKSKRILMLAEVLKELDKNIQLIIIGNGPDRKELTKFPFIRIYNNINENEKWKLISESLFMVFPSVFEGFGIPPAEALLFNKKVICSDIPIMKEIYGNKVIYFQKDNIEDLKLKISNLLITKGTNTDARDYVLEKYNWSKSARTISLLIEDEA